MKPIPLVDFRAAYGEHDDGFFHTSVCAMTGRIMAPHGLREAITFYWTGSERSESHRGERVHWAYIMDVGAEVVPLGSCPFRSEMGAMMMRNKAYSCAWTGALVSAIVPLARAIRDLALVDSTKGKRGRTTINVHDTRAQAEQWAKAARGHIDWLGGAPLFRWTDATGEIHAVAPGFLALEMGFRLD